MATYGGRKASCSYMLDSRSSRECCDASRRFRFLFLAILVVSMGCVTSFAQLSIRVGVYHNPPKVSVDDTGWVSGLFPALVDLIAGEENWSVEYVTGNWTESMARLAQGEIDIMVDVAYTAPRQQLYAFNEETILVNWGTVYTREDLTVLSLPELEGLRVAVMRGSTHTVDPGGILDLAERFAIACEFAEFDSYTEVFQALASGKADAGVVNRVFGLTFESEYGVDRTPIVFNPIELRFAFPRDGALTSLLISRVDHHLDNLRNEPGSAYYQLLEEHLLEIPKRREMVIRWPAWVLPALVSAGVLILGLLTAFLVVRREVRERIKAESALIQSEERFNLAMRGANDGLWDWNLTTDRVYFSPRWATMLGYAPENIEASIEAFRRLVHPDDLEAVTQAINAYVSGNSRRYRIEFRMLHQDGLYVDVLSRAFLVKDRDGTPARLVGTHVDISERKYAEKILREREAYLRTIIDHMPVDFFAIDNDYRYTMQSPTSKLAIGDVIGERADDIGVPEHLRESWVLELRRVFEGETSRREYDVRTTTGEVRTYLSNVAPVYVQGCIIAAIGTSLDITERKQAALDLQLAKERAEESDRVKSAFLATMSHELRTPLNSIIGFTGILLQELAGPVNEEQAKQLSMVQTSARHLLELINDILDISKIEAGQLDVISESFDVGALVRDVVETARPSAEQKKLELHLNVEANIGEIQSDRRRVGQILMNLISNAIKFTDRGFVSVECFRADDKIVMAVEDTGIGLTKGDLSRLFVPFQQVDSGLTRKYEGTGLGLSICKRLSAKLGGTISVESEPGRGSTFTVRLPANAEVSV